MLLLMMSCSREDDFESEGTKKSSAKVRQRDWSALNFAQIQDYVVVSIFFDFQPYAGKRSNLTNIFQMG